MNLEEFETLWEKHNEEFLKWERVEVQKQLSGRMDVHAFLLLDKLVPGIVDIVGSAEHDEIWLSIRGDDLAKVITENQIIELLRCGVRYDSSVEALAMFV